jgi:Golgi phosphoprotein 3
MAKAKHLFLYEEITLLALRDREGTATIDYLGFAIAGAVLAELLLDGRIAVDGSRKPLIDVRDARATGDPILDECLQTLQSAKRRASLKSWVSKLGGNNKLRDKVALQLCERKILRADTGTVLFFFTRKVYPEIDPAPEKEIIGRLHAAIFSEHDSLDARTAVLVSLANGAQLLRKLFGRKEIKERKQRIQQIAKGELSGQATLEAITAMQAAVFVAIIVPAIIAGSN